MIVEAIVEAIAEVMAEAAPGKSGRDRVLSPSASGGHEEEGRIDFVTWLQCSTRFWINLVASPSFRLFILICSCLKSSYMVQPSRFICVKRSPFFVRAEHIHVTASPSSMLAYLAPKKAKKFKQPNKTPRHNKPPSCFKARDPFLTFFGTR